MYKDSYTETVFETEEQAIEFLKEEMDIYDYIDYGNFETKELLEELISLGSDKIYQQLWQAEQNYFNDRMIEFDEEDG